MLYGKGAGVYPAANMIIRDLVEVATSIKTSSQYVYDFTVPKNKGPNRSMFGASLCCT